MEVVFAETAGLLSQVAGIGGVCWWVWARTGQDKKWYDLTESYFGEVTVDREREYKRIVKNNNLVFENDSNRQGQKYFIIPCQKTPVK